MKKSVLFFAALLCMMLQTVSASAYDRIITADQLPATAQSFIKEHFPGQAICYATVDHDFGGIKYEVYLDSGVELEFDKLGTWDKVDCNYSDVPAKLVPAFVAQYVNSQFAGDSVVKVDKERYGYDVELSSGLELKFNRKGQLMHIDD